MSLIPIVAERPSESGNHRRFARHRIETLAYVNLGPGNGGVLIDVSEGGMAFQGIQPLDKDQLLCINFKLPDGSTSLESTCQIAWLNDSGKGGGLRFIDLPEGTHSKIKEWFSLRTASRGPMENTAVPRSPVETKDLKSSPAIHLVAVQGNDASGPHASAREPVRDSSPSPVAATAAAGANTSTGVTRGSADLARTSELQNTFSETESRKIRVTPLTRKLLVSFAIVAILGAMLFPFHTQIMRAFSGKPQATGDLRLGLKLERSGTDWQVGWNRNTEVLLKAVSGQLSITDGQNTKELNLDPGELRSGSILYTPATDDVVVRLRVFSEISVQPVSESVRVVAGTAPPPPSETKTAGSAPGGATDRRKPTAVAELPTPGAGRLPKEPVAQNPTALGPVATKAATSLKTDSSTAFVDSKQMGASANGTMPRPTTVSRTIDSTIALVAPTLSLDPAQRLPAMLPGIPPAVLSAREPTLGSGRPDPAQLISRKAPIYPSWAKSAGIAGRVELHFTIGVDGNVHDVTAVKGNPLLTHAAVEAVQAWHYKPARLAGTPVQSDASTVFVFGP
jgi:TonB family protein